MNPFKALICQQYYSLQKQRKEVLARRSSTVVSAICIVLIMFGTFLLLMAIFPDLDRIMNRFFRKSFGRSSGKFIGQLIGLSLFILSYPIIRFTVGSEKSYNRTITSFMILPKIEKEAISKKGLKFFIGSIVFMAIGLVAMLLQTYI